MLQHKFQYQANQDLEGLFEGVDKFSTLIRQISQFSTRNPLKYDPDKYKGDAFEYFVEMFLNAFKYDNRVGISNYTPVQEDDNGVDGVGFNYNGDKSVVQVKYRSDSTNMLNNTNDHIGNLISWGILKHKVAPIEKLTEMPKHYVFTSAKGLHWYTDGRFLINTVKCFGYNEFKSLLDGNIAFWDYCRDIVKNKSLRNVA